jgi:hypothetical protein
MFSKSIFNKDENTIIIIMIMQLSAGW